MDELEGKPFQETPSALPGELGFKLYVPKGQMIGKCPLIPNKTTYAEANLPNKVHVHEKLNGKPIANFLFMGWEEGPAMYLAAVFHRQITTKELLKPVAELSGKPFSMERPWPSALLYLGALEDSKLPINVEIGGEVVEVPRLFEQLYYLPEGVYSSPVWRDVFVSHRDNFPDNLRETDVPVPGVLKWNIRNLHSQLRCLHPEVTLENPAEGSSRLWNWGTVKKPPPGHGHYVRVPPTNHVTWRQHCFDVNVQRNSDGQYILTRMSVKPPKGFRKIQEIGS